MTPGARTGGQARPAVVFVHGLWLTGPESLLLRKRLQAGGFQVHSFRYPTVTGTLAHSTAALERFVAALDAPTVHLVGHSLGGLIIYRFLERYPQQPPGRVVFLGTPAVGSRAALSAARYAWLAPLMGRTVAEELLTARERRWSAPRSLGIIAGSQSHGLGRLFAQFTEPNDGAVAVSETRMPGASDHLTLPVSHMGLLVSRRVAQQTVAFLREGRFSLAPQGVSSSARSR